MHEPAAATVPYAANTFARVSDAVDALSSAIAGFALLAGTRAFAFAALLAWREPVLGGAGLVLLAAVGWLRWQCGGTARAADHARTPRLMLNRGRGNESYGAGHLPPPRAEDGHVACYNRPSQCDSKRCSAFVERQLLRNCSNADMNRSRNDRYALAGPGVPSQAASRPSDYKETPC